MDKLFKLSCSFFIWEVEIKKSHLQRVVVKTKWGKWYKTLNHSAWHLVLTTNGSHFNYIQNSVTPFMAHQSATSVFALLVNGTIIHQVAQTDVLINCTQSSLSITKICWMAPNYLTFRTLHLTELQLDFPWEYNLRTICSLQFSM